MFTLKIKQNFIWTKSLIQIVKEEEAATSKAPLPLEVEEKPDAKEVQPSKLEEPSQTTKPPSGLSLDELPDPLQHRRRIPGKLLDRRQSLDPAKIDTLVRPGLDEEEEEDDGGCGGEQIQLGSNLARLVLLQDNSSRRASHSNKGTRAPAGAMAARYKRKIQRNLFFEFKSYFQ